MSFCERQWKDVQDFPIRKTPDGIFVETLRSPRYSDTTVPRNEFCDLLAIDVIHVYEHNAFFAKPRSGRRRSDPKDKHIDSNKKEILLAYYVYITY